MNEPALCERGFLGENEQRLLVDTGYAADGALTAEQKQASRFDI